MQNISIFVLKPVDGHEREIQIDKCGYHIDLAAALRKATQRGFPSNQALA